MIDGLNKLWNKFLNFLEDKEMYIVIDNNAGKTDERKLQKFKLHRWTCLGKIIKRKVLIDHVSIRTF